MPQQPFDKGSKFLLQKHARGVLLLGGAKNVRSVRALQAELVQPRKLPDGLLEVYFEKRKEPDHVLVEVATYPEERALDQALDDLALARRHLKGKLPELLMLVLCPKGKLRITGKHAVTSRLGWSKLACQWHVVEVWTLPAEELLALEEVSVAPWATLAEYDGPAEELLGRCRERIEKGAPTAERADLLAVSQVLAQLKYPQPELLALLGGSKVMLESPLLQDLQARIPQKAILELLKKRFGTVPREVRRLLGETKGEDRLVALILAAAECDSMDAFKDQLLK